MRLVCDSEGLFLEEAISRAQRSHNPLVYLSPLKLPNSLPTLGEVNREAERHLKCKGKKLIKSNPRELFIKSVVKQVNESYPKSKINRINKDSTTHNSSPKDNFSSQVH